MQAFDPPGSDPAVELLVKLGTPLVEVGLREELGRTVSSVVVEPPLTSAGLCLLSGSSEAAAARDELGLELSPALARTRLFDGRPRLVVLDLLADLETDVLVAPTGAFFVPGPAELGNAAAEPLLARGFRLRRLEPSETEHNLRVVLPLLRAHDRTAVVFCNVFARLGSDASPDASRERLVEYNRMLIRLSSQTGARVAHVHTGLAELGGGTNDLGYRCRGSVAAAVVVREIVRALTLECATP
jgi:hypothetical protein